MAHQCGFGSFRDADRDTMEDPMTYSLLEDVAAEIDIPKDGTLSRVLAKESPIRLVAFAFDAGQELTEHTAAVPVVVQVVSGSLTVEVGGERHRLTPRSWMLLGAGEPHSVHAEEPSKMLLTMIRGD